MLKLSAFKNGTASLDIATAFFNQSLEELAALYSEDRQLFHGLWPSELQNYEDVNHRTKRLDENTTCECQKKHVDKLQEFTWWIQIWPLLWTHFPSVAFPSIITYYSDYTHTNHIISAPSNRFFLLYFY